VEVVLEDLVDPGRKEEGVEVVAHLELAGEQPSQSDQVDQEVRSARRAVRPGVGRMTSRPLLRRPFRLGGSPQIATFMRVSQVPFQ
jgi:hypothetical protein